MRVHKSPRSAELPFQFSLHLRHPSIDPAEVSRELQLSALECFRAGAPRASRSGIAATAVHGETYWAAIIDPLTWSLPSLVPLAAARRGVQEADANVRDLPLDRRTRLKALVALAREQGFLSREQVREYLPAGVVESEQLDEVVRSLRELGISVAESAAATSSLLLSSFTPQEARVLRMRFGVETGSSEGPFTLGWALWLTCACLHSRHGDFLRRMGGQGGNFTLLVAYSPDSLSGFSMQPDTARQVSDLGLTIKFELSEAEFPS